MTDTADTTQKAIDALKGTKGTKYAYPDLSFVDSTEAFLEAIPTVTESERPNVTILRRVAREIDTNGVKANLIHEYRITFNALLQRSAADSPPVDEDEDFLNGP